MLYRLLMKYSIYKHCYTEPTDIGISYKINIVEDFRVRNQQSPMWITSEGRN